MKNPFTFEPEPLQGQANCGCQSRELEMDMEEFESEEEFRGGRRFPVRADGLRSRPLSRPLRLPKRPLRPPLTSPHRPWSRPPHPPYRGWPVVRHPGIYREPYGFEPEPAAGSEYVRWVQSCLNRILGLQLPVTGIMGTETRSALRSFQRQQGLRPSGIVGPDTEETLKAACGGVSTHVASREITEESELGPVSATLTWLKNPNNPHQPYLFTRTETANIVEGGIYIPVDTSTNEILKVGKSRSFRINPYDEQRYRDMEKRIPNLKFYLATVTIPRGHSVGGVQEMIETAIARLLLRAGLRLPEHEKPFALQPVKYNVKVRNVLPLPLVHLLAKAYGANPQRAPGARVPMRFNALYLTPRTYPNWEITPM